MSASLFYDILVASLLLIYMHFIRKGNTYECGVSGSVGLYIVGGKQATPNEFPWMALILYERKMHGAGSLINDRYILTAAHVISGFSIKRMEIVLGIHNRITMDKKRPDILKPLELIPHPSYNNKKFQGDIGLIKLPKTIKFKRGYIWPICLPQSGLSIYSQHVTVAGWGVQKYKGQPSRVLKKTSVKTLSFENCLKTPLAKSYPKIYNVIEPNNIFCAIGWHTDACQGDSGGPLMLRYKGRYIVIGIVSAGYECAKPNHPGIYTNVEFYHQWILNNTRDVTK